MSDRNFHLRLACTYSGTENDVADLSVKVLNDDKWEPLDLNVRSPGFLLFINGLFSCQHLYMRINSAECGLILESATGELEVIAGDDWRIRLATIAFKVQLKAGSPTEENIAYIRDRMHHCPVSSNMPDLVQVSNSVQFED